MIKCTHCGARNDPSADTCDDCGNFLKRKQASTEQTGNHDPYRHHCCYVSYGKRCHYLGTFGQSTTGGGGLYCRGHDDCGDPRIGAQIVERSHRDHPRPGWWTPEAQRAEMDRNAEHACNAWLDDHGHGREPFEEDGEYAVRMRVLAREYLAKFQPKRIF